MALKTAFTELLSIRHPVVLAPMARDGSTKGLSCVGPIAGADLAAAVSNAGGLGLIGGGGGGQEFETELDLLVARTTEPWGVGFITWVVTRETVERALSHHRQPSCSTLGTRPPLPTSCTGRVGADRWCDRSGRSPSGRRRRRRCDRCPGQRGRWPRWPSGYAAVRPRGSRPRSADTGTCRRGHRRWAGARRCTRPRRFGGDTRDSLRGNPGSEHCPVASQGDHRGPG